MVCLRRVGGRHGRDGTVGDFDGGDGFGGCGGIWDFLGVSARSVSVDAAGSEACEAAVGAGARDSGSREGIRVAPVDRNEGAT